MNNITFDEMLISNGLPPIGTIVTTPAGDRVEVMKYEFDVYDKCVKVCLVDSYNCVVSWTFDSIRRCTWEGKDE